MKIEKITDTQVAELEKKVGKSNLIVIDKKDKNGNLEGAIYLQRPSSKPNYFNLASRFRQAASESKDLAAGELILKNCYLAGIADYDPKQDKDGIRDSALYVGVVVLCFQAANDDFIQGAQGLGFRIM